MRSASVGKHFPFWDLYRPITRLTCAFSSECVTERIHHCSREKIAIIISEMQLESNVFQLISSSLSQTLACLLSVPQCSMFVTCH